MTEGRLEGKGPGVGAETTREQGGLRKQGPHWDRPRSDPVSQMTQFLRYLFQWSLVQGRNPEGKEHQARGIGKLEV